MAQHGKLFFTKDGEKSIQGVLENPVIRRFFESIERCENLKEIGMQATEMLKNCLAQKADPGTILDFQKILAVLVTASDNWSSTQNEISEPTRMILSEMVKYLKNQEDVEQNPKAKRAIDKACFLINAAELSAANQVLRELTQLDHKYRGISSLLLALHDGVNEEKRKNSVEKYASEAVSPIFKKVSNTLLKLERDPRPNPELSTADKEFIRVQLNELDRIMSYHPSLQLQQEASDCKAFLMMSNEVQALSAPARVETTPASVRKVSVSEPQPSERPTRRQTITFGEYRLKEQANQNPSQGSKLKRSSHDEQSKRKPSDSAKRKPS